jgi:hypothetical protein
MEWCTMTPLLGPSILIEILSVVLASARFILIEYVAILSLLLSFERQAQPPGPPLTHQQHGIRC